MTQEEILKNKTLDGTPLDHYIQEDGYLWKTILKAMQEYADQEVEKIIEIYKFNSINDKTEIKK